MWRGAACVMPSCSCKAERATERAMPSAAIASMSDSRSAVTCQSTLSDALLRLLCELSSLPIWSRDDLGGGKGLGLVGVATSRL